MGWPSRGFFDLSANHEIIEFVLRESHTPHMPAWRNWYHVTAHAYGAWLRGDARGWRARHHREHVVGDYKHPPKPGAFAELHHRSATLMNREAVTFEEHVRSAVLLAMVEKLRASGVEVIIAALDSKHLHLLARFEDDRPRHWIGIAKKHSSHIVRQEGLRIDSGGLWGKRSRAEPIRDRAHQLNAFRYIAAHGAKGAIMWTFRDLKK